jgi:GNAT superfamily N-acetyltransferase
MPEPFTLRPMTAADGEAVRHLMEDDPESGGMQVTARFVLDPVQAWRALKPDMEGVVAVAPDGRALGTATVSFEEVQYNGRVMPSAYLENLKVHHTARGQGIATALAQWRVGQAKARFGGGDGVILTTTSTDNVASLNTMKKWASQFYSPLAVSIRPMLNKAPQPPTGLSARKTPPEEYARMAEASNRFYADYQLYAPMSADRLHGLTGGAPDVYTYYAVYDSSGAPVAGALAALRAAVVYDQIRNMPKPLRLASRILRIVPADGRLCSLEVNSLWHTRLDAGHYLWRMLRYLYRQEASTATAVFDPRSPLSDVFRIRPWHMPKLELVTALHGPEPMDTAKPVCGTLRG